VKTAALLFFFAFYPFFSSAAAAEPDYRFLTYHPYNLKLGLGATLGPETPLILVNAEYNVDRFLGFGLMLQAGMGSQKKMFQPTVGGRFNVPLFPTERVNLSIQTGVGFVNRSAFGSSFTNFAYEFGGDVDVYILKELTVGLGAIVNVTSSRVERSFGSLYASASYRY
jgi:hypothetical protein